MEFVNTPVASWPELDLQSLAKDRAGIGPIDCADAFHATGKASENLKTLLSGEALCVTTGQQPGIMLGPLYTLYKALSATAVASRFQELLGRPVVPLFWVAGDDHDFAESNHTNLIDNEGRVEKFELRTRAVEDPSLPMYREMGGPEVADLLASITEILPPSEFRDNVVAVISSAYKPDVDLASGFAVTMSELLGEFGVPVFMPTSPEAKRAQMPVVLKALENASQLDRLLHESAKKIDADGGRVPVKVGDEATLVMLEASMGRDRLVIDGEGFKTRRSEERFSLQELTAIAAAEPTRLSANVLLRPVLEAALFPTLAYVGGPGELAYFPQCDPVYQLLDVAPQAKLPRWSARVMEHKVLKVLKKYSIAVDDLAGPSGELETRLAGEDVPPELKETLNSLRSEVAQKYASIGSAATTIDPTLKKSVESAKNQTLGVIREVEKKIISHVKQSNEVMLRQIGRARSELFPGGVPQERVLSPLPFLARYGNRFLTDAHEACVNYVADATEGLS